MRFAYIVFDAGGEHGYVLARNVCPMQILPSPLIDRDSRIAEDQRVLTHRRRRCNAHQRLAGTAWKHDYTGARTPVA